MKALNKEIKDLPENWQDTVVARFKKGESIAEVLKALNTSRYFHKKFLKESLEYAEIFERGLLLAESWWIKKGRDSLNLSTGSKFNTAVWFINMKNRFGWRDTPEIPKADDSLEDLEKRAKLAAKYKTKERSNEEIRH